MIQFYKSTQSSSEVATSERSKGNSCKSRQETTTYAAEEGAEVKEVDVATWELKSRHQEQPVQPTAAPGDVATGRLVSQH